MLWRACRGNVFLRQAEIETPLEDPSTVRTSYTCIHKLNLTIIFNCLLHELLNLLVILYLVTLIII